MAVSGNLGGKTQVVDAVLSSYELEICPTTTLGENCIELELQTDRSYYVDLRETDVLGFETETCQGSCLRNLQYQRNTNGAQRGSKSGRETDARREGSSSSHCSGKFQLAFNFFPCWIIINNQQSCNSNGLHGHKSYISNNFNWPISEHKGVLHCRGYECEEIPDEVMEAPLSEPFFTRRLKPLSRRPDVLMLYSKLRVDFFSTSELLYPNMKKRLRLIRARPNFYIISDNPNR